MDARLLLFVVAYLGSIFPMGPLSTKAVAQIAGVPPPKVHKLERLENEPGKVKVNGHVLARGMNILESTIAIGSPPAYVTFGEGIVYAHYTCDTGIITIFFGLNGRILTIISRGFF